MNLLKILYSIYIHNLQELSDVTFWEKELDEALQKSLNWAHFHQ